MTGASSGLGEGFARTLVGAGATVVAGARRLDRLEVLAKDLDGTAPGEGRLVPVGCDVTSAEDRAAARRRGRRDHRPDRRTRQQCRHARRTGRRGGDRRRVRGAARPQPRPPASTSPLGRRGHGARGGSLSIVNVSSVIGLVSTAPIGGASYAASKAGTIGLTRELAGQWGRRGIRVNAIVPGWFDTEMTDGLFTNDKSAGWVRRNTMLGRGGEAGEVDGALLFLASAGVQLRDRPRAGRRRRLDRAVDTGTRRRTTHAAAGAGSSPSVPSARPATWPSSTRSACTRSVR